MGSWRSHFLILTLNWLQTGQVCPKFPVFASREKEVPLSSKIVGCAVINL